MATKKTTNKHNNKNIVIQDLNVEFLSTKVDDYDVANCFFKVIDITGVSKLRPLILINADKSLKMPIWQNDNAEFLLKVKKKFVPGDTYCVRGGLYTGNVEFILYEMLIDGETIKGYYSKIQNIKKIETLDNIK
jgi:hypothetical protein